MNITKTLPDDSLLMLINKIMLNNKSNVSDNLKQLKRLTQQGNIQN